MRDAGRADTTSNEYVSDYLQDLAYARDCTINKLCRDEQRKSSQSFSKGAFCLTVCVLAATMFALSCSHAGEGLADAFRTLPTRSAAPSKKVEEAAVIKRLSNALSSRGQRTQSQSLLRTQVAPRQRSIGTK